MNKICDYCGKEYTPKLYKKGPGCCSATCNSMKWNKKNPEKVRAMQKRYQAIYSKKNFPKSSFFEFAMDGLDCIPVYLKMKRMAF